MGFSADTFTEFKTLFILHIIAKSKIWEYRSNDLRPILQKYPQP